MVKRGSVLFLFALVVILATALPLSAQSFRVQCPTSTITHPNATNNNSEPTYTAPTYTGTQTYVSSGAGNVNGAIKCQQISGGDGYATMGDGTQTYMFSFGPLSGLADIAKGQPGTQFPSVFNSIQLGLQVGDPATTDDPSGDLSINNLGAFTYNGGVGLIGDQENSFPSPGGVQAVATGTVAGGIIDDAPITNQGAGYFGPVTVTFPPPTGCPASLGPTCPRVNTALGTVRVDGAGHVTDVQITFAGAFYTGASVPLTISPPLTSCSDHNAR
jgi:hypothetical protein